MEKFWSKHAEKILKKNVGELVDRMALDLIHDEVSCAREAATNGEDYLVKLAEARDMIDDIFEIKKVHPEKLLQQAQK